MSARTGPWSRDDERTPVGQPSETVAPQSIRGAWTSAAQSDDTNPYRSQRPVDPETAAALASLAEIAQPAPPKRLPSPPPVRSRAVRARTRSAEVERASDSERKEPVFATEPEAAEPPPTAAAVPAPPSLRPVELRAPPAAPRGRGSLWGWVAAVVLLISGVAFYVTAYTPLRRELDRMRRADTTQTESPRAVAARPQPQPAVEQLAPPPPAAVTQPRIELPKPAAKAPAPESAAAKPAPRPAPRPPVTETKPAVAPKAKRPEASSARGTVDRAAAAAATAALEAEAYGGQPVADSDQEPSEAAETAAPVAEDKPAEEAAPPEPAPAKPDGLGGVTNDSNDPLEGL